MHTLVGFIMAAEIVVGGIYVRDNYGPFSKKDHNYRGHNKPIWNLQRTKGEVKRK